MSFRQRRLKEAHFRLLKCYAKLRSDKDLIHPVTHIVGLGGSAISRANK